MRLGGVLRAAAEILARTEASDEPLSDCLKEWGAAHRFAGSKDRAFIGTLCHDALRCLYSLQYKIDSLNQQDLIYAVFLMNSACSADELEHKLAGDKFAPPALKPAQKRAWQSKNVAGAADFIRADIPQWCAASFQRSFGADWVAEGRGLSERPPLDMRVNSLKAAAASAAAELSAYPIERFPLLAQALRIPAAAGLETVRRPNLPALPVFRNGALEIQDCGSQLAAKLCEARPHEQILDYCAGGGGKTLALAADMENSGQIYAYDGEQRRLSPIQARLARAQARNVQIMAAEQKLQPLEASMDCVVLDAPCSGAGTWRRRPETKWRLTPEILAQRLALQRQVLTAGARYVRPGGRLVYITCSPLYEENHAQIKRFLAENPSFRQGDMQALWARRIMPAAPDKDRVSAAAEGADAAAPAKTEAAEHKLKPHFTASGLLLSPRATQTDGFFISVLEKAAG